MGGRNGGCAVTLTGQWGVTPARRAGPGEVTSPALREVATRLTPGSRETAPDETWPDETRPVATPPAFHAAVPPGSTPPTVAAVPPGSTPPRVGVAPD